MRERIYVAAFVLILAIVPLLPGIPAFWITLLNYIGLASIVVLGLVLLTGIGGLVSFGQAAFVGIGAYTTAYLTTVHGVSPWLTLPIGLLLTGASAYIIGAITLRLSGHFLPLSTLAWGVSIYFLFGNINALGRHDGLFGIPVIELFGLELMSGRRYFYLVWFFVLLSVFATRNLLDSRPGRAIRALKGGGVMAESCGVATERFKILIFVYAAVLAGLSGWLYAHLQRAVNPTPFGLGQGIEYLFMAVIGGAGYVWGAMLGAGLFTLVEDLLQDILPGLLGRSGNFEIIVFGVLMVLLLQYAREGLWPLAMQPFNRRNARKKVSEAPPLPVRAKPVANEPVLAVRGARKEFGGLVAVNDVSFEMRVGEILGLIGPNGAGKSTIFNVITGLLEANGGEVVFRGQRLNGLAPPQIARLGVGRTFQHVRLLPTMTVLENVAIGAHQRAHGGAISAMLRLDRPQEAQLLRAAAVQLERLGLGDYLHEQAGNLPLGHQRILEIARALCADPVLLLLDESAAGLRYKEKHALTALLTQLRDEGLSILLVEHDMDFVMGLTDRLVVLDFGVKLAEGTPREIQANPAVLEAYLGGVA